jgi:hypothetical protein
MGGFLPDCMLLVPGAIARSWFFPRCGEIYHWIGAVLTAQPSGKSERFCGIAVEPRACVQ